MWRFINTGKIKKRPINAFISIKCIVLAYRSLLKLSEIFSIEIFVLPKIFVNMILLINERGWILGYSTFPGSFVRLLWESVLIVCQDFFLFHYVFPCFLMKIHSNCYPIHHLNQVFFWRGFMRTKLLLINYLLQYYFR